MFRSGPGPSPTPSGHAQRYPFSASPTKLASNEAVKRYVASEPNAIGYIEASLVTRVVRVALLLDGG